MRVLRLLLLLVFLAGAATGCLLGRLSKPAPVLPESSVLELPPVVLEAAFRIACEGSLIDCTLIPPPAVRFADLLPLGAEGMAPADAVILLDYRLWPGLVDPTHVDPHALGIMVHELVHYLDFATKALDHSSVESVCQSEARAWYVSNTWLAQVGVGGLARWDWIRSYPHCVLN